MRSTWIFHFKNICIQLQNDMGISCSLMGFIWIVLFWASLSKLTYKEMCFYILDLFSLSNILMERKFCCLCHCFPMSSLLSFLLNIWLNGEREILIFNIALGKTHYKVPVFFLHLKLAFIVLVDYFVSDNECPGSSVAGFLDIAPFHKRKNNWLWNVLWTRHL